MYTLAYQSKYLVFVCTCVCVSEEPGKNVNSQKNTNQDHYACLVVAYMISINIVITFQIVIIIKLYFKKTRLVVSLQNILHRRDKATHAIYAW